MSRAETVRAMEAIEEDIARGEPCLACGAEWRPGPPTEPWVHRELIHQGGCAYQAAVDRQWKAQ